jgi:flagellar biosynthesis protein FlhF
MRKVLRRVREDQGPDAVILSNRRTDEGIEIIAAIDYDESILLQTLGSQPGGAAWQQFAEPAEGAETAAVTETAEVSERAGIAEAVAEPDVANTDDEPQEANAASPAVEFADELEAARAFDAAVERQQADDDLSVEDDEDDVELVAADLHRVERDPASEDSLNDMRTEISSIRGLMESQLSELIWRDEVHRSPIQAQMLRNLARIGISPDIAAAVIGRLRKMPQTNQVWRAPLAELVEMIPVKEDKLLADGGIVAMIGPTGVGKTTSIAKIAARYAMLHGTENIALVCADSYRIGAREHLAAFGRIIGAQVHSVGEAGNLGELLDSLRSRKLILIDTDGVSQRDANLPGRLAEYRRYSDQVDFYLTLSATSQETGLDETIRRFSELPLAGAVISKIDEAGQLGCVIDALIRNELPALWFSDGQRIPDDIHPAARKRLWLVNQAIECMEASNPVINEQMMAERYAQASVAHA